MGIAIHDLEFVLILLLVLVVGLGWLSTRLKTPYPIVLVVGGLLIGLVPGIPHLRLSPDFVFLGVLPPLLFAAAFTTSWRDFRYNLISIMFLAFGLVAFTVIGIAHIAQWILPGFDLRLGAALGAVVCTTDAIAATSIARRVGLPRRIIDILEGESLLNDASGLLALEFAVGLVSTGQTPDFGTSAAHLAYLVLAGTAVGLAFAKFVDWMEHHIDHAPIEVTISIVTPYAVYLAAEQIHASGVLAAVACGLYLGRRSATFFSSVVRIEAYAFWNTLTFILNGAVFILIGLQLPTILSRINHLGLRELIWRGTLLSAGVIVLRLIWAWPSAASAYYLRRKFLGQPEPLPSGRRIFIVGWTGMRGVVALAAALSLPTGFPQRDVIVFLTFCVIFVTLVLQGLTLPPLIRKLGLVEQPMSRCEELEARRIMIEAALRRLAEMPACKSQEMKAVCEDIASHYEARLRALGRNPETEQATGQQHVTYENLTSDLRNAERAAAVELRDQERIGDDVLRSLLRELDLLDARISSPQID